MRLEYTIDMTDLMDRIGALVSQVADEAYSDAGDSLYDSIILTEKDAYEVGSHVENAVRALVTRTFDICRRKSENDTESIEFNVPDFDESMEEQAKSSITDYLVFYACSEVFKRRRPQVLPEYTDKTQQEMDQAVIILKSRKSPTEVW